MPRKNEVLSELLYTKTKEIVNSPANYTAFLRTAAQNYKYSFREQVLIYAQRPDATACAEIGVWNRLGRWVNRGATGIALLRDPNLPYRIRYVFDVSDTNSRENRQILLWQMKPEYENEVIHALQGKFLLDSNHYWGEVVETLSQQLAEEAAGDYLPDLLNNKQDSFLEELDDGSVTRWFKESVSESVRYMVLHRCGYAPELDNDVFGRIQDFNTEITASLLGSAVSTLSESILREIGVTVKSLERQQPRTFDSFGDAVYNEARKNELERSQNNGTDLQNAGRLPSTQPDSPGEPQGWQVRDAAEDLPSGASPHPLEPDDPVRDAVPAPAGDRRDGEPEAGADDAGADEVGGRDGGAESPRPDEMGGADEQPESAGRGDHPQRAGVQLTNDAPEAEPAQPPIPQAYQLSLFPTEEEQIAYIAEAESYTPSAFSMSIPQADIDHILRMEGNADYARMKIATEFSKGKGVEEIAAFLQSSFHGGNGVVTENGRYSAWYAEDGIHIANGDAARYLTSAKVVSWQEAAERIGQLLEQGEYATNVELAEAPGHERAELAQSVWYLRQDLSEKARAGQGRGDLVLGNKPLHGGDLRHFGAVLSAGQGQLP